MRDYLETFMTGAIYVVIVMIAVMIVFTIVVLIASILNTIVTQEVNIQNKQDLLTIIGNFLVVVIAVELMDTLIMYIRKQTLFPELILIVVLSAVAREVLVTDLVHADPLLLTGIGVIIIAIAGAYYLLRRSRMEFLAKGEDDHSPDGD